MHFPGLPPMRPGGRHQKSQPLIKMKATLFSDEVETPSAARVLPCRRAAPAVGVDPDSQPRACVTHAPTHKISALLGHLDPVIESDRFDETGMQETSLSMPGTVVPRGVGSPPTLQLPSATPQPADLQTGTGAGSAAPQLGAGSAASQLERVGKQEGARRSKISPHQLAILVRTFGAAAP